MTNPGKAREPWWLRAFNLAMHVAPKAFRDGWGEDMRVTFADQVRTIERSTGRTPWFLIASEPFQHIGILSLEFHVDKLSRPLL